MFNAIAFVIHTLVPCLRQRLRFNVVCYLRPEAEEAAEHRARSARTHKTAAAHM